MPGPLFLTAALEADIESLLALERESYTHPWTLQGFRGALAAEGTLAVALRGVEAPPQTPAGIVAYCVAQVVIDELHVHNLLVAPRVRRLGLGKRLLALVLDMAARRGAQVALLEVRQGNWAALHLYRSLGFAPVGLRRDYYEHPREDALVLRKPDLGGFRDP